LMGRRWVRERLKSICTRRSSALGTHKKNGFHMENYGQDPCEKRKIKTLIYIYIYIYTYIYIQSYGVIKMGM